MEPTEREPSGRCLGCYETLEEIAGEYHGRCVRVLFGSRTAPVLEHDLSEIEDLARRTVNDRLAVTGVQRKLSVGLASSRARSGEPLRLTIVGLWGRFILKPPTPEYPGMVENEDLTMHLAEACGIETAAHGLIRLRSGELCYLARRFDRPGQGQKLHVEDMAQITGKLTEDKYRSSLEKVGAAIVEHATDTGYDALRFLELVVFSFLTGNADMHLKNFSLLWTADGRVAFAPAYDLLATKLLLPGDLEETALPLNGKKAKLRRGDFEALGLRLFLTERMVENLFRRLAKGCPRFDAWIDRSFLSEEMKDAYRELVAERAERLEMV